MRTKPPLPMSGPSLNTGPSERSRTMLVGDGGVLMTVSDSHGSSECSEALLSYVERGLYYNARCEV